MCGIPVKTAPLTDPYTIRNTRFNQPLSVVLSYLLCAIFIFYKFLIKTWYDSMTKTTLLRQKFLRLSRIPYKKYTTNTGIAMKLNPM